MKVATVVRQKALNHLDNLRQFIDNGQPLSKAKRERLSIKVCEEDGISFLGKNQTPKWIEYLDGKY
jgi:hypothetical protein